MARVSRLAEVSAVAPSHWARVVRTANALCAASNGNAVTGTSHARFRNSRYLTTTAGAALGGDGGYR